MKFVDLRSQYIAYRKEIDASIAGVFSSCEFIGGYEVKAFESELSAYLYPQNGVGTNLYTIGCSSGTDALLLCLLAGKISRGDEVITTPYTFVATAEAIMHVGARPIFADVDRFSYNLDLEEAEKKITSKTKAIIPVSLFGETCDMAALRILGEKHNLLVIEDGAQSLGGYYGGERSCSFSDFAATSFFPSKPLGGYGDGGAVFTREEGNAKRVRELLNHGQRERYKHAVIGINGRLDALQAAILRVKLRHLDEEIGKRKEIAFFYDEHLDRERYFPQKRRRGGEESAYAQYSVTTGDRKEVLKNLERHGIPYAIYYPIPLHLQEAFGYLGHKRGDFPVAEELSESMFSLPIHSFLRREEVERVVSVVNS